MNIATLIALLQRYPEDTKVTYTYDSILSEVLNVSYEPETKWMRDSFNAEKLCKTVNHIVVLE